MAPQPPSPSASSTLLPFLGGSANRPRRGSLAPIQSTKGEIDKGVLSQALDDIHSTASKSEVLTSFHDYDGGPVSKGGAKELVTSGVSGVSGLYDKLKRGLGGGAAAEGRTAKDGAAKARPKTSASRDSVDVESIQSNASGGKAVGLGLHGDSASVISNPSAAPSPMLASPAGTGGSRERTGHSLDLQSERGYARPTQIEQRIGDDVFEQRSSSQTTAQSSRNVLAHSDVERARSALQDEDQSTAASQALARVLSHHGASNGDIAKLSLSTGVGSKDQAGLSGLDQEPPSLRSPPGVTIQRVQSSLSPITATQSRVTNAERPPLPRIGAPHLPGYEPSRASSTDGQSSSTTTANGAKRRNLDPSPNINTALQRRRTDMRPPPVPRQHGEAQSQLPTHLRRRVISKAFWMKDENAKDCFYCGQPFSTFRRKHHCRTCGQIFDAKCTSLVAGRPFGQPGTIRLCRPCESMIYGGSDDDSTVFSDDGASVFERSPMVGRRSFGDDDDDLHGKMDGLDDRYGDEVTTPSIGIPVNRRNRESKRRSAVIEFDAAPLSAMARPASSHSLMSLARRPRSSSHKRFHSRHQVVRGLRTPGDERVPFQPRSIGEHEQTGTLPAFHNDNVIDPDLAAFLSDDGSDDEEPQSSIFATIDGSSHGSLGDRDRHSYSSAPFISAAKKGRSRLGTASGSRAVGMVREDEAVAQATKHLPKLSRNRNPSIGSMSFSKPSPRRSKSQHLNVHISRSNLAEPGYVDEPHQVSPSTGRPHKIGTKLIRSSAMRGRDAPPVELNSASLDHVRRLLGQLLEDHGIPGPKAWERALMPILLQCTDDVEPNVQLGDDMDIRHYIKLKKVPGGRPGDTSYISGVVFSKNVALKSMARSTTFPRIAIVTFAIEYARHQAHFMSLEPVIAQEQEYLRNLVGRIAALKPSVLLVQRNVSGLAIDLLEKAGITVAYNIKDSVLAAVARMTQTTMIKSVDKLAIDPSHLGQCESFEIKTFVHDGARKTYIYLSGCQPDLGCTIVLRGADTKLLRRIKRITEFMAYVAYNLKLETNLLRDEFVSIPTTTGDQLEAPDAPRLVKENSGQMEIGMGFDHGESLLDPSIQHMTGNQPSKYELMEKECRSKILSASPFVIFMQPYMLTQLRDSERRLSAYKQLRDQYAAADEAGDEDEKSADDKFEIVKPEMVHVPPSKDQPKAVREYLHAVHQVQYDKTMHTYETQRKLMESFTSGASNPFDPFSHQVIIVLHSTVSTINSAPCIGPEQLGLGFYAGYNHVEPHFEEDCTLGQYVEDLCISAGTKCKECDKKMYDHYRQYVHGYGQLSVSVSRQPARLRGYEKTILMWSTCRVCKHETEVVPMSDSTWKYSFAKYLELSFWSSPLHPQADICGHDIHKDFLRCFGFEDLAVRVRYDSIDIYDVVVPRSTITWKVESDLTVKNEQYSHFVARLKAFTDSVIRRLDSINVDTLDEKKSIEATDYLAELRDRAEADSRELLHKLQQKYAMSRYYELIPLNRALRFMEEKALSWDDVFNDFERDYFPSETDIRKLATLQLKNMFLESQPAPSTVASDASDDEDGTELQQVQTRIKSPSPPSEQELHSEKAHDVLSSTVDRHRGSIADIGDVSALIKDESQGALGSSLARHVSPREEQEQVVQRDEVKHLDLAVPADTPEDTAAVQQTSSGEHSKQTSRPATRDGQVDGEPFATQTKPIGSGLLERIEQIRSNRVSMTGEQEAAETKIPRLADLRKRDASPQPSAPPPLLRAQSSPPSPLHTPNRSIDLTLNQTLEHTSKGPADQDNNPMEKRLGEKLGVGRLASKVGRLAPSLIPRSVPSKEDANVTRVSALAKHFEQMSREFEKERLKERKQRALQSRHARANPLASSRPVVEVYRNATDAVGERSTDLSGDDSTDKDTATEHQHFAEVVLQMQRSNHEELPAEQSRLEDESTQPSGHREAHDTDTEAEGSDTESQPNRPRDISDPSSTVISSGLLSPTSVPDIEFHPELSIPEHRKNVWFNYLTEFWSKRSASGWAPLEYPLHGTEHVFEDSDIIVREDEPSSVIALSLACTDYQNKLQEFRSHPKKPTAQQTSSYFQSTRSALEDESQQQAIEASLLSDTGTHMKYSFAHGQVKATCKIFYAESFDALRRRCGVADRFVESMSRCLKFDSKGGKTKSLFLKTLDDRFIIKSLQEVELKAFTKFAPDYFAFMSHTLFHGVPSVIAKMFGLFQVFIKNPATGMEFSYYLLVMENLFYERNPNRRFDLKGSMRNRKIESTGQPDEVLLDENLVETIFESPLFVREHARKLLQASVWNDTMWLCKQNVMDYSLMAGFDDERKELIVGIIDCIRTYTWDKKLESWIKDRGKNKPTITSPKDYRNRFRAPNCWHQFQAQMAPLKTLKESDTQDTDREADGKRIEG
ncbi:Mitochondrial distribution and morphology protein 12 [Extremus antarcticus]|uniref:1-phosphatidylinositol-3-phosphate 5-kinase n=1 Tax=Extremus antarcticus TaxID=702011 RepID=A0AAJ0DC74_9PEZI|nr:Mitochondrial distribution and morphology protein 12 [Extremus antarcticus]